MKTTDPQDESPRVLRRDVRRPPQEEIFDLVDKDDKVIGKVKRWEVHKDPKLIHRSAIILVFNKKGQLFLHKRSKTKDTYPGYWTASACGHLKSGQTYRQTAIRELEEELGIKTIRLKRLGKVLLRMPQETEFQTIYKATYDRPIKIYKKEIEQGQFFTLNENFFKKTIKKLKITPTFKNIIKNFLVNYRQ